MTVASAGTCARPATRTSAHTVMAISAQQLLCTAPLAVALAAVGKRLTGVSFADSITHVLSLSPPARKEVIDAFAGSPHVSLSALLINLVLAVAFGVSLAATLQRGLELIWRLAAGRLSRQSAAAGLLGDRTPDHDHARGPAQPRRALPRSAHHWRRPDRFRRTSARHRSLHVVVRSTCCWAAASRCAVSGSLPR